MKYNINFINKIHDEYLRNYPSFIQESTSPQAQRRKTRGRKLRVGPPEKSPSPQAPRSGSQGTSAQAGPGHKQQG